MTRVLRGVVLAVVLLFAASACGGGTSSSAPPASDLPPSAAPAKAYVALGDSYTAAPYVYLTDVADGCLRSNGNYPTLLAKAIGAKLNDVSCGGAQTGDLTAPQQTFQGQQVPAQLDALGPDTDLVTIGIGGNDFGLFGSLSTGCPITGPGGQAFGAPSRRGGACGRVDRAVAAKDLTGIQANVTTALTEIHTRAPKAKVVLVGYPRIASTTTTCPKLLPATLANAKDVDAVTRGLRDALKAAATATGTTFIDMYAASKGHDVCAGKAAWVNGIHTDTERAAPLHPFAEEQQAVAKLIAAALAG
ncbi:MAG: Lipase 2 precursor [Nocardioidaceae bacterium]|nr:Lipase 2 precursor [Nocardioidaceae bacterium]